MPRLHPVLFIGFLLFSAPAHGAAVRRRIRIDSPEQGGDRRPHRPRPITLDGRLDEPAWQRWRRRRPISSSGAAHRCAGGERTEVRVLYDDDNLYVGIICFDPQPDAHGRQGADARTSTSTAPTWCSLIIDSLHDRQSGFALSVNPAGARRDTQFRNNGGANTDWDGVWDVKTRADEEGWIAEFMIPFKTLRFTQVAVAGMGPAIRRRRILRLNEESNWAPMPFRFTATRRDARRHAARPGKHPARDATSSIKPFVVGGSTQVRNGDGCDDRSLDDSRTTTAGFDVKVQPDAVADARRDLSHRFRAGRGRPAAGQPDALQPVLSREARFLPRERRHFASASASA